jgi:predicted transcriptional regulator
MAGWTFLTNHAVVLSLIAKNPRITALELAMAIRITERAVRRIIANLTDKGYISKTKKGRGLQYHVNTDMPLRHHTHREVAVVEFLKALGWKKKKNPEKKKKGGVTPTSRNLLLPNKG